MHKISAMAKALKRKTTDTVSDLLATPARMRQGVRGSRYDSERMTLRKARDYDNAPNYDEKGNITDAFKARSVAKGIKSKYRLQGGVK